jgi:hypothetical protein
MSFCSFADSLTRFPGDTTMAGGFFKIGRGAPLCFKPSNVTVRAGTGSPQGVVLAARSSVYLRTDGGIDSLFYLKNSGSTVNTGWTNLYGNFVAGAQTVQTVTQAGAITTADGFSFYPVVGNAGAVTAVTMPNTGTAGQVVILHGTSASNTVQVADNAGNLRLASATRTLALNDNLGLVFDGAGLWSECFFSANG